MTKRLWQSLRLPHWQEEKWVLSEALLFETLDPLRFWTEHSERNWLVSILSMLDVPRDQRDFVGRWSVPDRSFGCKFTLSDNLHAKWGINCLYSKIGV